MRLINADELKKKLQARHDNGNDDFDKGYNVGLGTAIDLIDAAPTVENTINVYPSGDVTVQERPHGKWYKTGQSFVNPNKFRNYGCSICHFELDEHIRKEPNFCSNCGADMREEVVRHETSHFI